MAPSGLVISKLGIQATAMDDTVKGLMCLKISLPKDAEGRPGARWALFSSKPPKLLSTPTINLLPLPLPASRTPQLRTASKLLSLPQPSTYPPSSPSGLGGKPYIDISSTTGKIYVVLDPISFRKGGHSYRASGPSSSQTAGRKDWLICMDFEIDLENGIEEGISKVLLPIPKCLDNTIRFQILSSTAPGPSSSSSSLSSLIQEVNILTDPKMLPLPPNAFNSSPARARHKPSTRNSKGKGKIKATVGEEGWEDGEVLGPDDIHSESEEETELSDNEEDDEDAIEGGSWLEGRFPSTEILRLEWSFNASQSSDIPSLQISPVWNQQKSSISIAYLAQIPSVDNPVQLQIDVPDGWGWSEFTIQGEGLSNWRCSDGNWGSTINNGASDPDLTLEGGEYEDSFATVRAKRTKPTPITPTSSRGSTHSELLPTLKSTSSSSASLMRQTFPSLTDKMEDFSFELSSLEHKPNTPQSLKKSPISMLINSTSSTENGRWDEPKLGTSFNLYFNDESDGSITIQGTLVPIDNTMLISATLPVKIPVIHIEDQGIKQCQIECPSALYGNAKEPSSEMELVDIAHGGVFNWTNSDGTILSKTDATVKGNVNVKLRRSPWGVITASMIMKLPPKSEEIGFSVHHEEKIRMIKSTIDGSECPRVIYEGHDGVAQIRVGRGGDTKMIGSTVEIQWEIVLSSIGEIGLPYFDHGDGEIKVELVGDDWEPYFKSIGSNMKLLSANHYSHPLSSPVQPMIKINSTTSMSPKRRTLLSFSTLINLILLWLLLSMGQQLQRIKNEVDFVRDEYRDLRLYGVENPIQRGNKDSDNTLVPTSTTTVTTTVEVVSATTIITEKCTIPSSAEYTQRYHKGEAKRKADLVVSETSTPYPLGRVVFNVGQSWDKWMNHPTVKTVHTGITWIWYGIRKLTGL